MKCHWRSNKRLIYISRRTCYVWEICFSLPGSANHQHAMSGFFKVLLHAIILRTNKFYVHWSVHRESKSIIVQQDSTMYSLLYFCKLLYMFRVVTSPIIRSTYNCNYSIWFCNYSYKCSWWWVELPPGLTSASCCNYSYVLLMMGGATIQNM